MSTVKTIAWLTVCTYMMFVPLDAVAQKSKAKTKKPKAKPAPAATADVQQVPPPADEKPNLKTKPGALPATPFVFPKYEEFTLPNGLHVYVVENHEQPVVTVSLAVRGGEAADPAGKEGAASLMGNMLTKGTATRSAVQIADALDGVGASIGVEVGGEAMTISGSSLKKHSNLLMSVLSDVVLNPTFPQDELDKAKQQYRASVAYDRSKPMELAQALSRKVVYGMNNPLARRKTEKSIEAVTREDVVAFHSSFLRPNASSIAIVGDVKAAEVKAMLAKALGEWKKGSVPTIEIPAMSPEAPGVYFIPRKGAVQSSIILCAPAPALKDDSWLSVHMLAQHIGGGFGSVLFATLRETYSYTYSPFGFTTRGGHYNRIAFGAEVRTAVTDSAINVIMGEVAKLRNDGPDEEDFARRIATEVGQYRTAFEKPNTVAAILQNAWINEMPVEQAINYTTRLERIGVADVQLAAGLYLNNFKMRIVVVGNPDVLPKLELFGTVKQFTTDIEPATGADEYEQVGMSVSDIVNAYVKASGGQQAMDAVTSLQVNLNAEMTMNGNKLQGKMTRTLKAPNKEHMRVDLSAMTQETWTNGSNAWIALNGGPSIDMDGDETEQAIAEARIFPILAWKDQGYSTVVKGKKAGSIIVEVTTPSKSIQKYYFDAVTMLPQKVEKEENMGQGPVVIVNRFDNYQSIGGVMFPMVLMVQNQWYSMKLDATYSVNQQVADTEFQPAN